MHLDAAALKRAVLANEFKEVKWAATVALALLREQT